MSQLNTVIDNALLIKARQATGMYSDQALLEYALQVVVAVQQVNHGFSDGIIDKPHAVQRIGKASDRLGSSSFIDHDEAPFFHGTPLSLEDMDSAVQSMAVQQK